MAETELTYEQALEGLDKSLRSLEDGDLSLEAALQAVDDARKYLKICQDRLEEAKKRIEVRPAGETEPAPDAPETQPGLDERETLFR